MFYKRLVAAVVVLNGCGGGGTQPLRVGRIMVVDHGTKVKVIDSGGGWRQVRVMSGPHAGQSGHVGDEEVHK